MENHNLIGTEVDYYDDANAGHIGNYQFTSLSTIINQFMVAYVGEDKIISKIKQGDVAFHAQRAMQELSFDTFKSCKSQEITVPASLQMTLPQDYVNYTKISWVDSAGIKHLLYPTSKTSNPPNPYQNVNGEFKITAIGVLKSWTPASPTPLADLNLVVLDGEYNHILPGMLVTDRSEGTNGWIQPGTFVKDVSNNGGITTIRLGLSNGNDAYPKYVDNGLNYLFNDLSQLLTFSNTDGSMVMSAENSFVVPVNVEVSSAYSENGGQVLNGASGSFSNLKVGMVITNGGWPPGTFITGVFDTYVTLSIDIQTDDLNLLQGSQGNAIFISPTTSDTWSNYKSGTPSENQNQYDDDTYWPMDGSRYGLDPQHAQANGSFYIDCVSGKIHFSSNIAGKTVILDYISDSLGTVDELQVHKFAEEAMYKWIAHAILSTRANTQEYIVQRFKKERFAAVRTAKLRLSNIKLEEITQILRGKSKQIKH
tara:strand:- start:3872 stop:5314 length:1443 start_codon:yes stop_codon:yes gene_type:complete